MKIHKNTTHCFIRLLVIFCRASRGYSYSVISNTTSSEHTRKLMIQYLFLFIFLVTWTRASSIRELFPQWHNFFKDFSFFFVIRICSESFLLVIINHNNTIVMIIIINNQITIWSFIVDFRKRYTLPCLRLRRLREVVLISSLSRSNYYGWRVYIVKTKISLVIERGGLVHLITVQKRVSSSVVY